MANTHKNGFTLIELMIVIVIVAVLVSLAIPSFLETVRKSRRSDAMEVIMDIHLAQERWRVNHTTYGSLSDLGIASASPDGHYSLAISGEAATAYTITATAQGGQANDACGNFVLTFNAGAITKTTSSSTADQCWRK